MKKAVINTKEKTKLFTQETKENLKYAIIGFGRLLAVASIIYTTVVILEGTDGLTPKLLVAPQAILASYIAIKAFVIKRSK